MLISGVEAIAEGDQTESCDSMKSEMVLAKWQGAPVQCCRGPLRPRSTVGEARRFGWL